MPNRALVPARALAAALPLALLASLCAASCASSQPSGVPPTSDPANFKGKVYTGPPVPPPDPNQPLNPVSVTPGPPGGPGRGCTQIGCQNGLSVDWESASGWKPGRYVFEFELDGAKTTCEGALPLRACDAGPSLTCSPGGAVMIGESGCALPPGQHGFSGFTVSTFPSAVRVTIQRDGKPLSTETLEPSYRTGQPNGPGCEPVCKQAHAKQRVP